MTLYCVRYIDTQTEIEKEKYFFCYAKNKIDAKIRFMRIVGNMIIKSIYKVGL